MRVTNLTLPTISGFKSVLVTNAVLKSSLTGESHFGTNLIWIGLQNIFYTSNLLSTAFLQPVNHFLKLQVADLHLLFQLVDKGLIIWVQVVIWLLCVQAESCIRETTNKKISLFLFNYKERYKAFRLFLDKFTQACFGLTKTYRQDAGNMDSFHSFGPASVWIPNSSYCLF